jgi:hypothetical protein
MPFVVVDGGHWTREDHVSRALMMDCPWHLVESAVEEKGRIDVW